MTSNFIPYLPSSPPPLDDDDEDDDEFGNFTIASYVCNDKVPEHKNVEERNNLSSGTSESAESSKVNEIPNHSKINHFHERGNEESASVIQSNSTGETSNRIKTVEEDDSNNSDNEDEDDDFHPAEDIPQSSITTESSNVQKHNGETGLTLSDADKCAADTLESDDSSSISVRLKDDDDTEPRDKPEDFNEEFGNFVTISNSCVSASDAVENHIDAGVDQRQYVEHDDTNELDDSSSDVSHAVNFENHFSDDRRNSKIVHDDFTSDEQWDGFVSCAQVPNETQPDDYDDEFSDFVCPPSDDDFQTQPPTESASDSWPATGAVENVQTTNWPAASGGFGCEEETTRENETFHPTFEAHFDDNDDVSDFEVAESRTGFLTTSLSGLEKLDQLLISSFPPGSTVDDDNVSTLENIIDDCPEGESCTVWSCICDVEKTNSLTYQWSNSSSNKKFLKAINIDSRNLLFGHNWNSSVPLFAANLSLNPLEPTKTPLKSADGIEDKDSHSPQPQETIPPAQFDWNSSGLTNPLEASNGISALLDLDFFFTNETRPVKPVLSATWSLENELLGSDDNSVANTTSSQCNTKVSPLLEQILSSAKLSASDFSRTKQSAAHTPEAQNVLNKLPDLSFMQAKVLMFPIRSSSP